jgi:alkylation response protein AidB-like acyl-CoA dehydrogenase
MDDSLYFTPQHLEVRELVRDFAQQYVAPIARELDRNCTFPWENIKRMGELGLLGVNTPPLYGLTEAEVLARSQRQ